jgi:predicted dehydrogenase
MMPSANVSRRVLAIYEQSCQHDIHHPSAPQPHNPMHTPPLSRRRLLRAAIATGFAGGLPAAVGAADKTKTVAIIGDTDRGGYGHGLDTVWLSVPGTKIVGVSDPVTEGRTKALERLKLAPDSAFADYREMLAKTKPELVAVCPRYIDQHHDMIVAAIEAGARGLYVEKPFCRDLIEADAIVAACEKSGARLALAHRNRYHPVLPVVAKLIEEGAIGRLLEIRARGKEDARGGALDLWVLGSHVLNLCHYFGGTPLACSATVLQGGKPLVKSHLKEGSEGIGLLGGDEIHARFEMEKGFPVFFDSIAGAGTKEAGFGLQFIGNEGIIDLRGDAEPHAHLLPGSPFRPIADSKAWIPISTAGIGKPEPIKDIRTLVGGHHRPVLDLIAAIEEGRDPLCSDKDGRTVLEMTMAIFESHRSGGGLISLPLEDRSNPLTHL